MKSAGKGAGGAQACLTADAKSKVAKAKAKTTADATKSCGTPPSFGFASAATTNAAAQQAEVDVVADVSGANLDAAIITCATSKAGCGCQQKVSKGIEALMAVKLATFVACKKAALKAGASAAAALEDCVRNAATPGSIAADSKGKIGKIVAGLNTAISKSCDTPNVTAGAFPGQCSGLAGAPLGACLDKHVECRVCTAINAMDNIFVNCDLFDNGVVDASCASGHRARRRRGDADGTRQRRHATPTATTPSPTPTCVAPGIVKAAHREAGRFNYNRRSAPSANAACNAAFVCTHACTVQELQAGSGETVGLKDTATTPSAFGHRQLGQSSPTVPGDTPGTGTLLNWEYPTAHTACRSKGPAQQRYGCSSGAADEPQCNFNRLGGCCQLIFAAAPARTCRRRRASSLAAGARHHPLSGIAFPTVVASAGSRDPARAGRLCRARRRRGSGRREVRVGDREPVQHGISRLRRTR